MPVAAVPKQALIPPVGDDMVDHSGTDDQPLAGALCTVGMQTKKAGAGVIPSSGVTTLTSALTRIARFETRKSRGHNRNPR